MPTVEEIFLITRRRWEQDLRCINIIQMLDSRRPIFVPSNNEVRLIVDSIFRVRVSLTMHCLIFKMH